MYRETTYSPALLWVLWMTHLLLLIIQLLVTSIWILELKGRDDTHQHVPPGYPIGLALVFINLVAEAIELVLWLHDLLEPWVFLLLQAIKTLFWSIWSPLFIVTTLRIDLWPGGYFPPWLARVIRILTWMSIPTGISFFAGLLLAIIIFFRHRRMRGYEIPVEEDKEGHRLSRFRRAGRNSN